MAPSRGLGGVMSKGFKRFILGVSVVVVAFVLVGGFGWSGVRAGSQNNDGDGAYRQIGVYEEVLKRVQNEYVVDPNLQQVTTGALHGLLETLDSDSSYLSPEEYKLYKEHRAEGSAQIGLVMSKRFGYATVVTVVPGSAAAKEQIEDGDVIESIEGQSTREMSLATIRLLLEGKPGTSVTFSVVRPRKADPDKLTLTRKAIEWPAVSQQEYETGSILYLKPATLSKDHVDDLIARLRAGQKSGAKKILLDLRDVAEGDEQQGIRLANAFVQNGTIATLAGQKYNQETFTADASKFVTAAPLVVLVNHGTSGAAELTAAAVLDDKRGQLVGDRTFGEGAVQKTIELPDGGALILSVAKYASPSGKKIQDDAVTPNVTVASNQDDGGDETQPANATDDQLNKALEILKKAA